MSSSSLAKQPGRGRRFWKRHAVGYMMIAPFFLLFIVFVILPVLIAIVLSFTDYNMFQRLDFIGLSNYKTLLMDDRIFLTALGNTFVFAVIVGSIGYFMSFLAAWVINQLHFKMLFALAFYAPSITSGVAMSTIWLYFFSPDRYGLINNLLLQMGLISEPILWTSDPRYIMPVIIFISIWMSMGTGFLVFLAGLQNVDRTMYEAAAIDGLKTRWQELKYITLPCMKPQLLFGAITTVANSFGVFDVAVTVAGFPSPNYAGHTIVAHLYDYAFIRFQMGYASAVATVLFIITFLIGQVIIRLLSDRAEGESGR